MKIQEGVMRIRLHHAVLGSWLALVACHSDKQDPEPSSAENTQGSEDPIYDTPDGTVGPHGSAVTPSDGMPPSEGMGPGTGGPPDIVDGEGSGNPGGAGIGGEGGTGGTLR